jgi:hypothetical protein
MIQFSLRTGMRRDAWAVPFKRHGGFKADRLGDGRAFRLLNTPDDFNRERLGMRWTS